MDTCLFWGNCVVIPPPVREPVLQVLHHSRSSKINLDENACMSIIMSGGWACMHRQGHQEPIVSHCLEWVDEKMTSIMHILT